MTHQKVAAKASTDLKTAKMEHLAFLYKILKGMRKSVLFKYYAQHEPLMLENIRRDKKANGYKITSCRMFEAEVNIMTDVIFDLNAKGIHVLYIYDALVCEEKDTPVVIEAMDRVILEHEVKTAVKVDTSVQPPPLQAIPMFRLSDEINLYEVLPLLSFTAKEAMNIIHGLDKPKATLQELVVYIGYQRKQQRYNDYNGVIITPEHIAALKVMLRP